MNEELISADDFILTKIQNKHNYASKIKLRNTIAINILSFFYGVCFVTGLSFSLFFKDVVKFQPGEMSKVRIIQGIPWLLRPIYGLILDCYPKRKIFLILFSFVNFFSWYGLAKVNENSILLIYFFTALAQFSLAFLSVISRALLIETSKLNKDYEISVKEKINQSSISELSGRLFASLCEGVIASQLYYKKSFLLFGLLSFFSVIASLFFVEIDKKKLKGFYYSFVSEDEEIINSSIKSTDIDDSNEKSSDEKNSLTILNLFKNFICKRTIYPALIFAIVYNSVPSTQTSLFYYSINYLNITVTQLGYISILSNISIVCSMIFMKKFLKSFTWEGMIKFTTILNSILGIPFLILHYRKNAFFGISDMEMLSIYRCINAVIERYTFTPFILFSSMITPKGFLSTGNAIFSTCLNLGVSIRETLTIILCGYFGITSNNFENFYVLIILDKFGKLLTFIFLFFIKIKTPKVVTKGSRVKQK